MGQIVKALIENNNGIFCSDTTVSPIDQLLGKRMFKYMKRTLIIVFPMSKRILKSYKFKIKLLRKLEQLLCRLN